MGKRNIKKEIKHKKKEFSIKSLFSNLFTKLRSPRLSNEETHTISPDENRKLTVNTKQKREITTKTVWILPADTLVLPKLELITPKIEPKIYSPEQIL